MSIPGNITREHIEKALDKINKEGIPDKRISTDYNLVFDGRKYPPKYVISLANKHANKNKKELPPSDFSGGAESNQYLQRLGFEINNKDGKIIEVKKIKSPWVATVILESKEYFCETDNKKRHENMLKIINATAERTQGDGVFVFPGGFFNTGRNKVVENYSKWVEDLKKALKENIVVCFGVDGRKMKDQLALAVSREGCIAMGRKFYPTADETSVQKAEDYKAKENGKDRTFELAGKKYYLAVCYDVFGIHQKKLENPGVDVVLNFVHQFNPGGSPPYFIRGVVAGSRQWARPVFASATFFRRRIQRWPSGVFWNQGEMASASWKYEHNPIEPSLSFREEIPEGQALIRVFKLRSRYERKG